MLLCRSRKCLNCDHYCLSGKRDESFRDPDGKIAHVFNKVNVKEHGKEVKEALDRLQEK